jgi:ABC-type branched-subunit amino acid transport system substrate-binding protein
MVGTYKPCAEFIKLARMIKLDAVFVNISFVGSEPLAAELRHDGEGVIVTQVVPLPNDSKIPLVARYQRALKSVNPSATPSFVSLEGYVAGRLVVEALKHSENPLTRAGLLATIKDVGIFDLDGVRLSYGPASNQGMNAVYFTVIQPDGSFKAVERLSNADVRWQEPPAGVDVQKARVEPVK